MKQSEDRTSGNSRSRSEKHLGVERRDARREEDEGGGDEANEIEELLKTFWLAMSNRRL